MAAQMNHFRFDSKTAYEAQSEAQRIAFAPMVFQACRILRDAGILELVRQSGSVGMTLNEVVSKSDLPRYGTKVLLEAGLGIGLFCINDGRFTMTKLGYFVLLDSMTRVNMDVVHDVCYRGLFDLEKAIRESYPAGLKTLGDWKTVYEGLSSLPPEVQRSWLSFDHYYSDGAFPAAIPFVFADRPKRVLDVGGNTGRFAIECIRFDPNVRITIADLPQQLKFARDAVHEHKLDDRVDFLAIDLLDELTPLPRGYDIIWMSQFLDCFSEKEIISILRRVARALPAGGALCVLELFWDRQPNETAAFCLQQTSLYFACIANGNSQIYQSADLLHCLDQSGLEVIEDRDGVGPYHTLLKCRKG